MRLTFRIVKNWFTLFDKLYHVVSLVSRSYWSWISWLECSMSAKCSGYFLGGGAGGLQLLSMRQAVLPFFYHDFWYLLCRFWSIFYNKDTRVESVTFTLLFLISAKCGKSARRVFFGVFWCFLCEWVCFCLCDNEARAIRKTQIVTWSSYLLWLQWGHCL